jgi:chitodextrinase/predicted esterase
MKKNLLLTAAFIICMLTSLFSQNVFNPNDPIVNFNGSNTPPTPPANTLAKWGRTPHNDFPNPFNTDNFKAYYYSGTQRGTAFRLRYPNNYNPVNATKYPVILFFHGIGETGPATDNEYQLAWGAKEFESKINAGQFNAFLLFPQTSIGDWAYNFDNINNVLDLMQQYCNTDPDRLITMGLSLGGDGTMKYTFMYPQRSAISIPASPGSIGDFTQDPSPFIHVPFWIASGGQDAEFANPQRVQAFVNNFTSHSGDIRWTYYPDRGHGTWPYMWDEPYLIPYWQNAHKANPLVFNKQTDFPANTPFTVKIGITPGYAQYQWQRNGADITNNTNDITVSQPGTYRVRFRRVSGGVWSDWSPNPAVITQPADTDNTPPSVPGNLRVVSTTTSSVSLDWDNSTDNVGVTGYDVYVNGTKKYSSISSDVIADNLIAGTTYTFTVQAHDQVNNFSPFSNAVNGTTASIPPPVDNTPPSVPGNLRVLSSTTSTVSLDWDNSSDNVGVTGYDIFVNGVKKYSSTSSDVSADNLTAGTTYSFTVQAHDAANNFSALSNAVNGTTTTVNSTGALNYKFYQGSFSVLPNFNTLTPAKTGTSSNVDISVRTAGVNDNFAFLWEGYIILPASGTYTFETVSDDGSKLYFNSLYSAGASAIVNNDGLHAATSATGTVTMAAGTYPIAITFFEATGGENMQVYWSGPGFSRQLIPGSAFTNTGTPPPASSGLNYKYYEGSFTTLPDFNTLTPVKTGATSNADISIRNAGRNDNFAFVWEGYINITTPGSYIFETISDDGSKLYFNTTYSAGAPALVNNDGLHAATSATGSVTIPSAGSYPIAITFFEATGGETMQVYWSGPGIARQLIPNNAFSSTGTPPSATGGLNYKFYQGSFSSLPDFSTLTPVKTGSGSNVDLSVRNPGVNDNFAFVWEGYINITTPGNYTFETISDDGSKLYFNSLYSAGAIALVNNDGLHAPASATGTVTISSAGTYPIAITFFEATGGETMQVYWSGPGIARQLIPNSAFTATGTPPPASGGLNYKYYQGTYNALPDFNLLTPVKTGTSPNADISVRDAGVNDNFAFVWEGYIHLPAAGTYTFETISDDGSKLYFNSIYSPGATALVNNDGLHAPVSATGTVTMAAGSYPIAITFFEQGGGETMQVYWSGPGIPRQLIPNSAFTLTSSENYDISMSQTKNTLHQTGKSLTPGSDNFVIKQIYPNPFNESFTINFYNASPASKISIDLLDVSGRLLYKQYFGNISAGNASLKVDASRQVHLPGVYFVRMMVNGVPLKLMKLVKK